MTVTSVALGAAGTYRTSSERALVGVRGALINPARRGRQTPSPDAGIREGQDSRDSLTLLRASNPPEGTLDRASADCPTALAGALPRVCGRGCGSGCGLLRVCACW